LTRPKAHPLQQVGFRVGAHRGPDILDSAPAIRDDTFYAGNRCHPATAGVSPI